MFQSIAALAGRVSATLFGSRKQRPRKAPSFRPRLQTLDERILPAATFTVNSLADTVDVTPGDGVAQDAFGNTTLRAAIQEANALPGNDTIKFAATLSGTIQLAITLDSLDSDIVIDATGAGGPITVTRAAGAAQFGIFRVNANHDCTIKGLTITGGDAQTGGGGIQNYGILLVENCTIYDNKGIYGGGINNADGADLQVKNCFIYLNRAESGGGISNAGKAKIFGGTQIFVNRALIDNGGGIYNSGDLTIEGASQIYSNVAANNGGGIYSSGEDAKVTVTGGLIEANEAVKNGGGVYIDGGTSTFNGVSIQRNAAKKGGGAYVKTGSVTFTNCTILQNTASVLGPGICYVAGATVTVVGGQSQGTVIDPNP